MLPDPPVLFVMAGLLALAAGAVLVAVELAHRLAEHQHPETSSPQLRAAIFELDVDAVRVPFRTVVARQPEPVTPGLTAEPLAPLTSVSHDVAVVQVPTAELFWDEAGSTEAASLRIWQVWAWWSAMEARRHAAMPPRLVSHSPRKALMPAPQRLALTAAVRAQTPIVEVAIEEPALELAPV